MEVSFFDILAYPSAKFPKEGEQNSKAEKLDTKGEKQSFFFPAERCFYLGSASDILWRTSVTQESFPKVSLPYMLGGSFNSKAKTAPFGTK